jgi:predicted TIM-barrel fold metal-dependent hydrolase
MTPHRQAQAPAAGGNLRSSAFICGSSRSAVAVPPQAASAQSAVPAVAVPPPPSHLVDVHTHAFPENVADRAVAALAEAYQLQPVAPPTLPGLVGWMDEVGIDVSVVLPVATRADQVQSINDWAATGCSGRIVCFGALHPDFPNPAAEVERLLSMGIKGIKLHPDFQAFRPEEERAWPIYEAAQGRLIVLFHSGEEIEPAPTVFAQPAGLAEVHRRFPDLTLVIAHLGGFRMWSEAERHLVGEDLYLEDSYCSEADLPDAAFVSLVRAHGTHRVLFGSDFPWGNAGADVARLRRLGLTSEQVEDIAWRNANALLGLGLT